MDPILADRFYLHAGDTVHRYYQVLRQLGEGTFGVVFHVRHTQDPTDEKAVKILKLYTYPPNIRNEISKRFDREYECGKIKSDYLVAATEKGVLSGNPYFIMEFCSGGSAKSWIGKGIDYRKISKFCIQVVRGLETLHRNGVIHRDLKPDNILFTKKQAAKLTDFGIAGYQNSRMTKVNIRGHAKDIFGTYAYIAPEQAKNAEAFKALGPMADFWSFGVTLYEIISGRLPFGELIHDADLGEYLRRAAKGEITPIQSHRPDIPLHLARLIERCLHPSHQDRLGTSQEALDILGEGHVQRESNPPKPTIDFYRDQYGLKIMHGDEPGRIYNLSHAIPQPAGKATLGWYDKTVPGRNTLAIVEKNTKWISRFHATIEKDGGRKQWVIKDGQQRKKDGKVGWHRSLNGTLLNGQEVDERGKPFGPNDIITIGDTTLKVVTRRRK